MPPLRSFGSVTRQVVAPVEVPVFVTVMLTVRPAAVRVRGGDDARRERADARDRHPRETASRTTATITPMTTVPWACEAAGSLSPSGLQRSHSAVSMSTGAPQRTQPCVRVGGFGAGSMAAVGVVTWSMVPRNGSRGGGGYRRRSSPFRSATILP